MNLELEVLGARLRRTRVARGLSLDDLSARLDGLVTKAALSKYELGRSRPRPTVLSALCRALNIRSSALLADPAIDGSVEWLAYRKHASLPVRSREHVEALAVERVEVQLFLQHQLHPGRGASLPPRKPAATVEEAEVRAAELRKAWRMGDGPVPNLVSTAEDHGTIVVEGPEDPRFDALSGRTKIGVAVIVVNPARPDDRTRFNVAHELGHLMMDGSALERGLEERLAHRFAAALLIPREAALRELGTSRTSLAAEELRELKLKYGVSMQAWTYRARDLCIIGEATYRSWQIFFRSTGQHVRESVTFHGEERPKRMELMCMQAQREGLVDEAWVHAHCPRAATTKTATSTPIQVLLAMTPEQRDVFIREQSERAAAEYASDPEVEEWLDLDEPIHETEGT